MKKRLSVKEITPKYINILPEDKNTGRQEGSSCPSKISRDFPLEGNFKVFPISLTAGWQMKPNRN